MKQKVEEENVFPISKQKTQKGVRKILRSKVLQVLYAFLFLLFLDDIDIIINCNKL